MPKMPPFAAGNAVDSKSEPEEDVYTLFMSAYGKLKARPGWRQVQVPAVYGEKHTAFVQASGNNILLAETTDSRQTELNVFSTYETTLEAGYMFNTVNLLKTVIDIP